MKNIKYKKIINYSIQVIIAVLLIWNISKDTDFSEIKSNISNVNYFYVTIAIIISFISHISRAIRWKMIIDVSTNKVSNSDCFWTIMYGYMVNLGIPRAGEISRCLVLKNKRKISLNMLFGTVLSERIFDFICLIIITILVFIFQYEIIGNYIIINFSTKFGYLKEYLTIPYITSIIVILIVSALSTNWLLFYMIKKNFKYKKTYLQLKKGIKSLILVKSKFNFLFQTVLMWSFYILSMYFSLKSMNCTENLTLMDSASILIVMSLAIILPLPAGGAGAFQTLMSTALSQIYLVPFVCALSYSYWSYFLQVFTILIGGLISIPINFNKKISH